VGVNPEANLVSVKVLDREGQGNSSDALAGIQWIIDNKERFNIRVANLSIGTSDAGSLDPLVRAVEAAWDAGIVMVIAAGNNGPSRGSITSPGTSRKVITVGAYDDGNCVDAFGASLVNFSGRGPTSECVVKPDVLATGCEVISCLSNSPEMSPKRLTMLNTIMEHYVKMSGTSMASPAIAGAISLLLTQRPHLSPNEVKLAIKHSSTDLFLPPNRQGWGKLDINALLAVQV
jgi:serine protease AprX